MKKLHNRFPLLFHYAKEHRKLSKEEEKDLLERWKSGDSEAFEILLRGYAPLLVHGIVKFSSYFGIKVDEETESEILELFIRCLAGYDPDKTRLSTYIMNSIRNYFYVITIGRDNCWKYEILFTDYKHKKKVNPHWQIKPMGLMLYLGQKATKGRGKLLEEAYRLVRKLPKKERTAAKIFLDLVLFDDFGERKFKRMLKRRGISAKEADELLKRLKDFFAKHLIDAKCKKEELDEDVSGFINPFDDED